MLQYILYEGYLRILSMFEYIFLNPKNNLLCKLVLY